jgi:site-specific DNA recombinase
MMFRSPTRSARAKPAPFDVVVVHSFSRFFRDHFELEFYVRKLARNGVKLVSITQEMGDDPMHVMMRQIMALFDEYQSKENAKHVLRAMNENARQGFWNGALAPIGYRIVAAEQRGAKTKKKLEIDPLHADTVRLIYWLFLEGDGRKGTRSHKDRERKPESEVAIMACPPQIDRETFNAVQARLKSRNPRMTPARVTSGPTLLTGICFCAQCGGAMTLRTGKGSAGGVYRYYTCSTKARQGETGCKGRSIPMQRLDDLVARHLEDRLFQPQRLEMILASVLDRRQERTERRREHLAELNKRIAETDQRLNRLFDAIESGVADLDAPGLKDRIAGLKAIRDQASADADRAQAALDNAGNQAISPEMVTTFARAARQRIRMDGGGYRRDHLRALAQRVEVADTEVRIMGSKSELLRTLIAASGGKSGVAGVQSSVLKWRTRQDSNLWPLPSEGSALSS